MGNDIDDMQGVIFTFFIFPLGSFSAHSVRKPGFPCFRFRSIAPQRLTPTLQSLALLSYYHFYSKYKSSGSMETFKQSKSRQNIFHQPKVFVISPDLTIVFNGKTGNHDILKRYYKSILF